VESWLYSYGERKLQWRFKKVSSIGAQTQNVAVRSK
jgi:hypothetical protein